MAARLRRQILAGEVAPGQSVPSLTTLSREFGHARTTCGKAMRLLEQEGLLTFIPGLRSPAIGQSWVCDMLLYPGFPVRNC